MFFYVDDVNNSQITNPIKCDIDSYRETCEETQSDLNNVDTIHGFGELENEEIVVSYKLY